MKILIKARRIFSHMPVREKIASLVLLAVFSIYLGQFIFSFLRFPLKQESGVYAETIVGHLHTLNPLFVDYNDADRDVSQLIFSGLIKYDPVKKNFLPDLATAWERSSNGLTYTFTLRADAKWHDLTPVSTADVVFTFKNVIQHPAFRNPMLKNAFEGINITETAGNKVIFILSKPNSYFISNLTVGILPQHLLEEVPVANLDRSDFSSHPVGTGPYMVNSVKLREQGDTVDLSAFTEYYGQKPNIERIRLYTFPTENQALQEIGAIHGISRLTQKGTAELEKNNRFAVFPYTLNQFTALYFNMDNPKLRDKKFRQALSLGLDKTKLVFAKEQRVDSLDLLSHENDKTYEFNIETAKKNLDEMGYKSGGDGMRADDKGQKLEFNLLAHSKIPETLFEEIEKQWKELGVSVNVVRADQDFYDKVTERRYDILLIKQNLGYNRDVYPLFHSSQIGQSGLNFSNFRSFRTDGITEAIRKETNPGDKEKLLIELSKAISEEIPVIFLSTPVYSYALDKKIGQFPATSLDFHSDRFSILPFLSLQNI